MKKNSKIILSLFLSVFMMIAIVGCDKKEDVNVLKKEVSFIAPNGVPATAISKMIKENIQVDDN